MPDDTPVGAQLNAPSQILVAGRLYTPEEIQGPVAVMLEGATIRAIWRDTDAAATRHIVNEKWPGSKVVCVQI